METVDEHGTEWYVKPKDPAMPIVRELMKRNFSLIVLPRQTYLTGRLTEDMVEWKTDSYAPNDVRLLDCVRYVCTGCTGRHMAQSPGGAADSAERSRNPKLPGLD